MRNALILLAVVALLILAMGALNNGTAFNVDYAVGTANAVSLFWVSAVIAVLVFVVGLVAAWFALAATTSTRRKLEAELQSTYERLREAESLAARPAPAAQEPAADAVAATVVAEPEAATVVETEAATVVAGEAATVAGGETATIVAADAGATVAEQAAEEPAAEAAGEQTAITLAGPPAGDASSKPSADEDAQARPAADDAGQPGQPTS